MAEGFDAASALSGAAVAAAGRTFVCRYVGAYAGDWRATSTAELQNDLAHGVTPVLNYEGTGKDATSFANGVADAKYADARVRALGFPGAVIYFSVDEQMASNEVGYFQGVESVIGHDRAGVYGGYDTMMTVHGAGLCSFFWMTFAWQNGRPVPSFVHIYQYRNGQTVNGMSVDFDRSYKPYFGQIGIPDPNNVGPVVPFDPTDYALLRRQKEDSMYVRGTSDTASVYCIYTDATGRPAQRLCGSAEAAYANAGGLVIVGDDPTLMNLGAETGYEIPLHATNTPERVNSLIWGRVIDRGTAGQVPVLQDIADTGTIVRSLQTGGVDENALAAAVVAKLPAVDPAPIAAAVRAEFKTDPLQ